MQVAAESVKGVTRWRRSAIIAVPAAVVVTGMATAMVQGVLAASLSVSGQDFKIGSDNIDAQKGLAVTAGTYSTTSSATAGGDAAVQVPQADLPQGICISVHQNIP